MSEETQFQTLEHEDNKWSKIKSKTKVDPNLEQEKTKQLWSLLDQFPNVFAWHKGEFRCCKYGEHIVDIFGFLLVGPLPVNFHFGKRPK
jgi:hypothetical protein